MIMKCINRENKDIPKIICCEMLIKHKNPKIKL